MREFQNLRVPAHSAISTYFIAVARRSALLQQSHSPKDLNFLAIGSVVSKLPKSYVRLYLYLVAPWFVAAEQHFIYLWGFRFGRHSIQRYLVGKC